MSDYHDLLSVISIIGRYIEQKAGGTVNYSKYVDAKDHKKDGVIIRWKRYDIKTKQTLLYNHKVSYAELKVTDDPTHIAKTIVAKIKKKDKSDE